MSRVLTAGRSVLGVVLLLLVGAALVVPATNADTRVHPLDALLGALALGAVLLLAARVRRPPGPVWLTAGLLVAGGVAVALVVGWSSQLAYGWDAGVVRALAERPTQEWTGIERGYLSTYPNLVVFVELARGVRSAGAAVGLDYAPAWLVVNAVALGATLLATWAVGRRLAGARAAAVAVVLAVVLLGVSPWTGVPYTDAVTLWVPVVAVWCAVRAADARRAVTMAAWAGGAGAAVAVGTVLKTTPVHVVPALLVWFLVVGWRRRPRRPAAALPAAVHTLVLLALLAAGSQATTALGDRAGLDDRVAGHPLLWVAAGQRTQVFENGDVYQGLYDGPLVVATRGRTTQEQGRVARFSIERSLETTTPQDFALFHLRKAVLTWTDGMFFAWGEGPDRQAEVVGRGPGHDGVEALNTPRGRWVEGRVRAADGLWLAVLATAGVGCLLRRRRPEADLLACCVLGMVVVEVLLQARGRYVLADVPLLLVLAASLVPLARPRPAPVVTSE